MPVGIGDLESLEDFRLEPFHRLGLTRGRMVEAEQMQDSVHREVRRVIDQALAGAFRFFRGDAVGDGDIAKMGFFPRRLGKRQHIGRCVLAAKRQVQRAQMPVAGE